MRLIRQGTFETNSSSTHALVIPHKVDEERYDLYESLDSNYGFGRDESRLVPLTKTDGEISTAHTAPFTTLQTRSPL